MNRVGTRTNWQLINTGWKPEISSHDMGALEELPRKSCEGKPDQSQTGTSDSPSSNPVMGRKALQEWPHTISKNGVCVGS